MNIPTPSPQPKESLSGVIFAYLKDVDAGRQPDREQILRSHPEWADDLRQFFVDQDAFHRVSEPLHDAPSGTSAVTPTYVLPRAGGDLQTPPRQVGDYELLELIARGGMGVVYKARHVTLNRFVALKMLLHGASSSPEDLSRFRAEAEAVAAFDHPNIVPIYDVGDHEGNPYFAMKFIDGGSLVDRRADFDGHFTESARLIATIARAIHYAHQHGIIHRDLKPGNILLQGGARSQNPGTRISAPENSPGSWILDSGFSPYVTDFGLAKRLHSDAQLTQTDAIVGTPNYMAPEQAAGVKALTTAVDVYGLGAILYELLAGRKVFAADQPMATLMMVREQEPEAPRQLRPTVPEDLQTICLKCLEKEPNKRYVSAEALAADLECWLRGDPISARPVRPLEKLIKWTRRRPALAAMGIALVALFLASFALIAWQWRKAVQAEAIARSARDDALHQSELNQALAEREKAARATAEQQAYFRRIDLARFMIANGDLEDARNELQQCPWNLCQIEWHSLYGPLEGVRSWPLHKSGTLRSDGRQFALAGPNDQLIVVDLPTYRQRFRWTVKARALAYQPGESRLAVLVYEQGKLRVHVRNTNTGVLEGSVTLPPTSPWKRLSVSSEGTVFVAGKDQLRALDIANPKDPKKIDVPGDIEHTTSWKPNLILVGRPDGTVEEWDTAKEQQTRMWPWNQAEKSPGFAGSFFDVSKEGWLAKPGLNRTIDLINLTTNETTTIEALSSRMTSAVFSPDGRLLHTGWYNGDIRTWNLDKKPALVSSEKRHALEVKGLQMAGGWALSADPTGTKSWPQWREVQVDLAGSAGARLPLSLSQSGARAALAMDDREIRVWNTITGEAIARLKNDHDVTAFAVTPAGLHILSAGGDRILRLWDVAQGQVIKQLKLDFDPLAVAVHPDGDSFAVFGRDAVHIVDGELRKPIAHIRDVPDELRQFRFSRDGTHIGGITKSAACVWNIDGTLRHRLDLTGYAGGDKILSADLSRIVHIHQNAIRVVDLANGATLRLVTSSEPMLLKGAFSPDDQRLAVIGRSSIEIRDPKTGNLVQRVPTDIFAADVAFLGDNRRLAVTLATRQVNILGNPAPLPFHGHGGIVGAASAITGDDGDIFVATKTDLQRWNAETGEFRSSLPGRLLCRLSLDGREIVTLGPDSTILRQTRDGQELQTWAIPKSDVVALDYVGDRILAMMASGDLLRLDRDFCVKIAAGDPIISAAQHDKTIAVGTSTGPVILRDAENGQPGQRLEGHKGKVLALAWSKDGRVLASAGADNSIRLWNPATGACLRILQGHTQAVTSLAFRKDGKQLASGSDDCTIAIWDVATGRQLISHGGTKPIHAVAFLKNRAAWTSAGKLLVDSGQ